MMENLFQGHEAIALLSTYLLTGLTVGFGHCIGMCGPLVISFSLSLKQRNPFLPQMLYHCGRTATYGLLGTITGATGSFAVVAANIESLQVGAMFFAGVVIIVMGLAMGQWIPRVGIFNVNHTPGGIFSRLFKKMSRIQSVWAYFPMGLLLGLLPCGPVYTTLLGAARAGMGASSIYHGMAMGGALMVAFGIGTVPALFLVAKLASMGRLKYREKIYKAGALLMIGVGGYFIYSAMRY